MTAPQPPSAIDDAVVEAGKRAPVQGFSAGIPWEMHLRAYDAYCKRYGPQKALIDLEGRNCRGGFGARELDELIPGWREELDERAALQQRVRALEEALRELLKLYGRPHADEYVDGGASYRLAVAVHDRARAALAEGK